MILRNLSKKTESGRFLLKDINLEIKKGDFVALTGESGAGKSTLINILSRITPFDAGEYSVFSATYNSESDISFFNPAEISTVLQDGNFIPDLTAKENIMLPQLYSGKGTNFLSAEKLAGYLNVSGILSRKASKLSGGEQQRIALIKAISSNPEILLLDEPVSNLDSKNKKKAMELLSFLNANGMTIVMAAHDKESASFAKRIIRIEKGIITDDIPNNDIKSGNCNLDFCADNAAKQTGFFPKAYSMIKEKKFFSFFSFAMSIGLFFSFFSSLWNSSMIMHFLRLLPYYDGNSIIIRSGEGISADILKDIPKNTIEDTLELYETAANLEINGNGIEIPLYYGSILFLMEEYMPSDFAYIKKPLSGGITATPNLGSAIAAANRNGGKKLPKKLKANINGNFYGLNGIISPVSENTFSEHTEFLFLPADFKDNDARKIAMLVRFKDSAAMANALELIDQKHQAMKFKFETSSAKYSETKDNIKILKKHYCFFTGIPVFILFVAIIGYSIGEKSSFITKSAIRRLSGASEKDIISGNFTAYAAAALFASLTACLMYYFLNFSKIMLYLMPEGYGFAPNVWALPAIFSLLAICVASIIPFYGKYYRNFDRIFRDNRI